MKTNPRVLYAGTLSVVTSIVLLVALVALNMLIGLIPDRLTQLDLTSNKIYSVSQTTKDYLSSPKEDVTVYVLCADGDASVILAPLLDRFGSYPHVKVENVNTTLHPEFKDAYTEDELDNYSIIVESARRYQVIGYYDMMFYQHETLGQIPYQEYQKNVLPNATLYQYYYQVDVTTAVLFFDGEHVLTSAIEYVSLTSIPPIQIPRSLRNLHPGWSALIPTRPPATTWNPPLPMWMVRPARLIPRIPLNTGRQSSGQS